MSSSIDRSAELCSRIFHAAPVAFAVCTLKEGRFLEVNGSFLSLTGLSREEVIGSTDLELGVWADLHVRDELSRALTERQTVRDIEWRIQSRTGEVRNTLASVQLFELRNERCLLFIIY